MLSNRIVDNTTKIHMNIQKIFLISLYNSKLSEFIDSVVLSVSTCGMWLSIFHCDPFPDVVGLRHRRCTWLRLLEHINNLLTCA